MESSQKKTPQNEINPFFPHIELLATISLLFKAGVLRHVCVCVYIYIFCCC